MTEENTMPAAEADPNAAVGEEEDNQTPLKTLGEIDLSEEEEIAEAPPAVEVTPAMMAETQGIIATLQQEIAHLRQQLEQQSQQLDAQKSQAIRIAADFDNFRKRTQKEKEDLEIQTKRNVVLDLLTAVDSFERARAQIKPANDGEMAIHKSYQGVYKQLVDGLKRIGVAAMRAEGEPFDPNYHEAVYQEETDEHPEGSVMEQVVRGYLIHDRVLRHAMVKVAAAKTSAPEAESIPADHGESLDA